MSERLPPELTTELELATLRALVESWLQINASFFHRALVPPVFRLSLTTRRLGMWNAADRSITISRDLVLRGDWGAVVEVLKHETAHQYVHEVLGHVDETAHGPAFRSVCQRLGIDSRATAPAGEQDAKLLRRVAKLLALSQSPNEFEASLAMQAAQRLMLEHNISLAPTERQYQFRHLGSPTGRVQENQRILAGILARHFFVQVIWVPVWRPLEGKRGTVLEVCGTPVNLDLAEHVHTFLTRTAESLWEQHRATLGSTNRDRQAFLAGVMTGFRAKLDEQERQHKQEALVWVGDADLDRYYHQRHPRIRMTYHASSSWKEANRQGQAAGRKIVLHRPITPGSGGRLLPARSGGAPQKP